jgi:hypothetical protein
MTRALGIALVILGMLVLTPAGAALEGVAADTVDGFADDSDPQVIPTDPAPAESDGPELASHQSTDAVTLTFQHSRVQQLLAGRSYVVESTGPWSTGGTPDSLVGAIVIIRLAQPASYPMAYWPMPQYDGPADTSYTSASARFSAQQVTDLIVSVDLVRNSVVGIEPDGDDLRITTDSRDPCRPWIGCT